MRKQTHRDVVRLAKESEAVLIIGADEEAIRRRVDEILFHMEAHRCEQSRSADRL